MFSRTMSWDPMIDFIVCMNIACGELALLRIHNSALRNHDNFVTIMAQDKLVGFYCADKDQVMVVSWDLFVHIFDIPTWCIKSRAY